MSDRRRFLLLSLKPRFAEMILTGSKTIELRRIRPKAPQGTGVLVYASSPERQLVGTCRVASVHSASPDEIWELHSAGVGLSRGDFDAYFEGARAAVAIQIVEPTRLETPVPLAEVRRRLGGFHPPQSFRYVSATDASTLIGQVAIARRSGGESTAVAS